MGMQQHRVNVDLRRNIDDLIKQAEPRDTHHFDHQDRVAHLACAIGEKLSLHMQTLRGLSMAAMLHDIGMVTIPESVFGKPGELTDSEFELLKQHPETGCNMLKAVDFLWPVAEIVRQHHEHFDGTGYPRGLTDAEILDEAKILAVADTVEAITSTRPYRPAANLKEAIEEVERRSGTYYEPDVVEAFLKLVSNGELQVNGYRS